MARPLMQHGIGQLEQMFATMTGDMKVLKQLENELSYRQVPRAYALAEKVAMALGAGAPATPAPSQAAMPTSPRVEADLFGEQADPVPVFLRPKAAPAASTPAVPREPRPALPHESQPAVTLDEAFKLLNVTQASAWEQVEESRQRLVNQAHPALLGKMSADQRAQVTLGAKRVNAAYAVLAARRLESRLPA